MNKLKMLVPLLMMLVYSQFGVGQQLPYLTTILAKCKVSLDPNTGFYYYKYTVQNGSSSVGSVWQFSVDITKDSLALTYDTLGLKFSQPWVENAFRADYPTLATQIVPVGFPLSPTFWSGLLGAQGTATFGGDGRNDIRPNTSLDSFQLMCKGIPGIRNFTAEPYIDASAIYPSLDDVNDPDSLLAKMSQDEQAVKFQGRTVGPVAPALPFDSLKFLDTLKSYINQSRSFGWISDTNTAKKYTRFCDSIRAQVLRGSGRLARQGIDTIIANANRDSSAGIMTSEACALLKFDAAFLKGHLPKFIQLTNIPSSWNMVGVAVEPVNFRELIFYPTAQSPAYTYKSDSGYVTVDPLTIGAGYWVKFPSSPQIQTLQDTGLRIDSLHIHVVNGWNMFGSLSYDFPVSKVQTEGITLPQLYYGYKKDQGGGYYLADTIKAGFGFWTKANGTGNLILDISSPTIAPVQAPPEPPPPAPGSPSAPTLQSPTSGATGQILSPTFSWYASTGALSYNLQVSTTSSFSTLVYNDASITTTTQQVGGFSYSTTYYWRVNASNDAGTSYWSTTWSFTTQGPPPPCDCCVQTTSALDQFTVTDANGNAQSMYFYNTGRKTRLNLDNVDLPPQQLSGLFTARFQSGKYIETIPPTQTTATKQILIKNAAYPLSLSWNIHAENKTQYWLVQSTKGQKNILLTGSGSMQLSSSNGGTITIQAAAQPPPSCE